MGFQSDDKDEAAAEAKGHLDQREPISHFQVFLSVAAKHLNIEVTRLVLFLFSARAVFWEQEFYHVGPFALFLAQTLFG